MITLNLRLSDLAGPDSAGWSDVAVFVRDDGSESEPFVVIGHDWPGELYARTAVQRTTDAAPMSYLSHLAVRILGRGRLEPAQIVMEGESAHPPDADGGTQVTTIEETVRAILAKAIDANCVGPPPPGIRGVAALSSGDLVSPANVLSEYVRRLIARVEANPPSA